LVSVLDEKGSPTPVERVLIRPPESRIGPMTKKERNEVLSRSPLKGRYDEDIDRESAFEMLKMKAKEAARVQAAEQAKKAQEKAQTKARRSTTGGRKRQGLVETMMKSVVRTVGTSLGRQIVRGIMGSLLGGRK
jgi:hypothetical protein